MPSAAGDGMDSLHFRRQGRSQGSAKGPSFACKTSRPAEPRFYLVLDTTAASAASADGGAPAVPPRDGTYVLRRVQTVCRAALVQEEASAAGRASGSSADAPVPASGKRRRAGTHVGHGAHHPVPVRRVKLKATPKEAQRKSSEEKLDSDDDSDSDNDDSDSDNDDSDDDNSDDDDSDELAALERDLL